jgi:hypothetical protein
MRNCHPVALTTIGPIAMLFAPKPVVRGGALFWSVVANLAALLLDLVTVRHQPEDTKDLEIAVLRCQLRMLERRQPRPRLARWERLTLTLLATKLRRLAARARRPWSRSLVLVMPETALTTWGRESSACDTCRMKDEIAAPTYAGYRFPPEIIGQAVWLYFRFALSYRDVEELLAERGVILTYETIRQLSQKFGQAYANGLRRRRPRPGDTWHLDGPIASPPFGAPPRRTG